MHPRKFVSTAFNFETHRKKNGKIIFTIFSVLAVIINYDFEKDLNFRNFDTWAGFPK